MMPSASGRAALRPLTVALLCGALVWMWQFLTVTRNYHGNWTALFCTGEMVPVPPAFEAGTYRFPGISGYDGQSYRYIAHDPLFRKGYARYCEDPRLRYRRILIPALAFLLAAGQDAYIDSTYIAVVILFLCAGVYWTSRWASLYGRSALWGALFLLLPGTLTSIDRMLLDGPCSALFAAFVLYSTLGRKWTVWCVLAAAALTRETGLLFIGGACLFYLARKQIRTVMLYATAALPLALWTLYVNAHTPPSNAARIVTRPVYGIVMRLFTPESYPFSPAISHAVQTFDVVAICGHLLAFGLAVWWFFRTKERGPAEYAALLFTALGLSLGAKDHMADAYGYARPMSPLYLFLFLRFLSDRVRLMIAPMLMISAQILLYFLYQLLGILGMVRARR